MPSTTNPTSPEEEDLCLKLSTARAFVGTTNSPTPRHNNPGCDLIRSFRARHFRTHGLLSFAQNSPVLGTPQDIDAFCIHTYGISGNLSTRAILMQDVLVNVKKSLVVARMDLWMLPGVGGGKFQNDVMFLLRCDESGEKVVDCCVYLDTFASQQIRERTIGDKVKRRTQRASPTVVQMAWIVGQWIKPRAKGW